MGRKPSIKRIKAKEIWLESYKKMKLKDLAEKLRVSETQIRKWKSEDKWDLESMYPNIEAWQQDCEKIQKIEKELLEYKGHLLDSGKTLYEYLTKSDKFDIILDNLTLYAYMKNDEDTTDTKYIALK